MKYLFFATALLGIHFAFAQQNVGIGTSTPTEKLHVNGNVKADTLKPDAIKFTAYAGTNKVLTSDILGNASWQFLPSIMLPFSRTQPTDGAPLFTIHNNNTGGGTAMNILANYSSSATAIRGESTTGRAGVFTTTSGTALQTSGRLKFTGIEESDRAVLTSDASGNATWSNRLFFKAVGFATQKKTASNVSHVLIDWASIVLNINGNSAGSGGFFDNANGKYIVLKKGVYRVSIRLQIAAYDTSEDDYYLLSIRKNETSTISHEQSRMQNEMNTVSLTTIVSLEENDFVQFVLRHNGPTSVYIRDESVTRSNEFTVEKID